MKNYSKTGFLIEALLLTNIWVFLFHNILRFLNLTFAPKVTVEFIRYGAVPKPFDIPLYLILSFLGGIFAIFFHKFVKIDQVKPKNKLYKILSILILIWLVNILINNLGGYPMKGDFYPFPAKESTIVNFFFLTIYLVVITFIILQTAILSYLLKLSNRIYFVIFSALIVVIIAFFTFEPGFPISGHDYSFFFGPIIEVAQGKTIYTQIVSQYGFSSILIFALLYKLSLFNLSYFPTFIWFLYIIFYFSCFYLIYKVGKSISLALIGLFSIITINYYSIYHLPITLPQVGPMRWLPILIPIICFFLFKKIDSKKLIFFISLASFWMIDAGIALILSYLFTLFIFYLTKVISFRKMLTGSLLLVINNVFIFVVINLAHIIIGLKTINIYSVFSKLQSYAGAGFGMLPMDEHVYFWIFILLYLAVMIYFARREKPDLFDQLLIYCANSSLFASIYFVGRSHLHNLFHISAMALLTLFIFLAILLNNIHKKNLKLLAIVIIFLLLVIIPAYNRKEIMAKTIQEKLIRVSSLPIFKPEMDDILTKKYKREIDMIMKNLPKQKILILSDDDTYLFLLTKKANLLNIDPATSVLTKKDLDEAVSPLIPNCPTKIVADCSLLNKCSQSQTFNDARFYLIPLLFNKIQEVCNTKYEPVVCTDQLCVAEKTKNHLW